MSATPLETFDRNIGYARGLVHGGRSLEHLQVGRLDHADLYRAAWTQAVSALDHWLHAEIYARAPAMVNRVGGRRPPMLWKVKLPFELIDQVQHHSLALSDAFRQQIADEIGRTSFPQIRDLVRGMQYLVCLEPAQVQSGLVTALNTADGNPTPPWTRAAVDERHRSVLARRNAIAHEADLDPVTGDKRPMTELEAAGAVDWVEKLGRSLHSLL